MDYEQGMLLNAILQTVQNNEKKLDSIIQAFNAEVKQNDKPKEKENIKPV